MYSCRLTLSLVSVYGVGAIYMRNQIVALSLTSAGILIFATSDAFASCSVNPSIPANGNMTALSTTVTCASGTNVITPSVFPLSVAFSNLASPQSLSFVINNVGSGNNTIFTGTISAPYNNYSTLNFDVGTGNTFTFMDRNALYNYQGTINVISGTVNNRFGAVSDARVWVNPIDRNNPPNVACYGCNGYSNVSVNAPQSITRPTDMTLWGVTSAGPLKITSFTLNPSSSQLVTFKQIPGQLGEMILVAEMGSKYTDYTKLPSSQTGYLATQHGARPTFSATMISVQELPALLNRIQNNPSLVGQTSYQLMDTKANILAADTAGSALNRLLTYDPDDQYAIIGNFYFSDATFNDGLISTISYRGAGNYVIAPSATSVGRLITTGTYSPLSGETVQATGSVVIPNVQSGANVIANGQNNAVPQVGSIGSGGTLDVIAGTARLSSVDGGTVGVENGTTLTGVNSAAIAVNSGTASINGTADGQMTVGNNGTLKGSGTVTGQTTIGAGGTLSPGNSPGILNFTSSVTQSTGSTLNIDIDGPTAGNGGGFYSRLSITGSGSSYTIAPNAILTPTLRGITQASISEGVTNTYTPPMGSKFVIVQAAGGISGTFGSLVQPASGLNTGYRFVDTYPTNAVNLYVVPNSYAAIGASKSVNAGKIASVIDGIREPTADRATALGSFYSLPDNASVANALQQLSGYSQTSIVNAAVKGQQAVTQTIEERMASLRRDGGLSGSDMSTVLFSDAPISQTGGAVNTIMRNANMTEGSTPKLSDGRTWMMPIYQFSRGTADTNSSGIKTKTIGAVAGSDFTVDGGATFGGALSYVENTLSDGDKATNYGLSVYGLRKLGAFYAAGSIVATYDSYQLNRTINFSDLSRTANSKVGGYQVNAGGEIGYQQALGELNVSPFVGANIKSINRNSFTESGANALDLSLNAYNKFNLNSKVGVRFSYKMDVSDYAVMPFTEFAWLHDFADPTINLGSNIFATPYTIQGTSYGRDAALVGAGLTISKTDNLKFLAKYAGEFRNKENSNRFNVGVVGKW